jgi:hypothetical protein
MRREDRINQKVRKWRDEFKPIPAQLPVLKKWAGAADGMAAEG